MSEEVKIWTPAADCPFCDDPPHECCCGAKARFLAAAGVSVNAVATFSERGIEITVIDPGPACCRACGGDLVDGAGCAVCGDRYAEKGEEAV